MLNREMLEKYCREKREDLHEITEIDFSGRKIREIHPETFKGLNQLKIINLSNNNISHVHQDTFKDLFQLTTIYLHQNQKLIDKEELEFYFEDKVEKITFHCTQDRDSIRLDKIHNVNFLYKFKIIIMNYFNKNFSYFLAIQL